MLGVGGRSVAAFKFDFYREKPGNKARELLPPPLPKRMADEMAPLSDKYATTNHMIDQYTVWASLGVLGWVIGRVGALIMEREGFFWIRWMKILM